MKLLYTRKQFQGEMKKALAPLKQENEELRSKIDNKEFRYLDENDKLKNQINEYKNIIITEEDFIQKLKVKIEKLTEDKKLLFGAKGGLTKYTHRLEKELKEVKKELEPVKAKNTQVMKTKSGASNSRIIKKVIGKND